MAFQASHPNLTTVLQDRGIRATFPRKAITRLLEQKQGGFTIESLSEELPSVGRATVYRTVKLLLEEGVICRLAMMDGSHVYSVSRAARHHHHYVCVKCGEVAEFRTAAIERLLRSVGADIPGHLVDHRIELYVACDYCPADGGKMVVCSNRLSHQCWGLPSNGSNAQ